MLARCLIVAAALLGSGAAGAAGMLDLSRYRLTGTFALPAVAASEASAVTYDPVRDSLFVIGDEGRAVVEVDRTGVQLSVMTLTGFDDTEGIAYLGSSRYAIAEEGLQAVYLLDYVPGGSADRGSLQSVAIGPWAGNSGLEGISFEVATGDFVSVKEKAPQGVQAISGVDFASGTATVAALFDPTGLGLGDLSDVQVLANAPALAGTPAAGHLLILSQQSRRLVEVDRAGTVLGRFDFDASVTSAEGVAIDDVGTIFVVDETPTLYVLTPVPEPSGALLTLAGLGLVVIAARRRAGA